MSFLELQWGFFSPLLQKKSICHWVSLSMCPSQPQEGINCWLERRRRWITSSTPYLGPVRLVVNPSLECETTIRKPYSWNHDQSPRSVHHCTRVSDRLEVDILCMESWYWKSVVLPYAPRAFPEFRQLGDRTKLLTITHVRYQKLRRQKLPPRKQPLICHQHPPMNCKESKKGGDPHLLCWRLSPNLLPYCPEF